MSTADSDLCPPYANTHTLMKSKKAKIPTSPWGPQQGLTLLLLELCFQNKSRSSKWKGKFCVHDRRRVQQLLLFKAENKFCKLSFFFPLAGREIPISKKKGRKKVTHSFSKFYSVADLNLNVDSKIIATPGCDLKALGNFSSLPTGRHSQWLEQGLHGGGYRTARTTQCQKTHKGGHCFGKASSLVSGWLWHPTHTLEWPWPLPRPLTLQREEMVPTHLHCSLSPSSIIKSKAVILGRGTVLSPCTQFLLAPSFLWKSATTINYLSFGDKSFDKKCALSTKAFILSGKLGIC